MPDHEQLMRRQQGLADFGDLSLRSEDLDEVLTEACRLVGQALGTKRAKVLEIQHDEQQLLVRAGVGWDHNVVGQLRLPMREHSSETYAIKKGKPVISQDISKDERFEVPEFMRKAGVVALANVPIFLPGGQAYGLLQVDATEPRQFGEEDTQFLRTYAALLGPVIDRLHKLTDLGATEERFRLIVEAARDYAIFLSDAQDRITDWPPGAEAVFGWTAEEAVGQPSSILFTHEDRERGEDRKEIETAQREGWAPDVRWHVRKDGKKVFIEGATSALRAKDGHLRGFLKIGQDVTERRKREDQLRASEARLRTLTEGIPQLVWRSGDKGQWTWASPQWTACTGQTQEESLGLGWLDAVHADDRDTVMQAWERVGPDGLLDVEYRVRRASDGTFLWHHTRSQPVRDKSGKTLEWLGTSTDVHDVRLLQARQEVLVKELQHRTRNLMNVVRAIADRTIRGSVDLADFKVRYSDRLAALARVQDLLSRLDEGQRITFDELIRNEVATLEGDSDRVTLEGPVGVQLHSITVQALSMALHELTTNTMKYGALSQPQGQLEVCWRLVRSDEDDQSWLHIDWRERGVVLPAKDTQQQEAGSGAGRDLIERALPYQFGARTTFVMEEDGVHCTIALPASEH